MRRRRVSESVRVRQALAVERKAQRKRGIHLTHGIVDTYDDYGCRCQPCRTAKAKQIGRPRDPHWPAHLVDTG